MSNRYIEAIQNEGQKRIAYFWVELERHPRTNVLCYKIVSKDEKGYPWFAYYDTCKFHDAVDGGLTRALVNQFFDSIDFMRKTDASESRQSAQAPRDDEGRDSVPLFTLGSGI